MPRLPCPAAAALCAALCLAACSDVPEDTHPQKLVSQRQAIFKDFTRTLEPMGLAARERKPYVPGEFMASALALQRLSTQPWVHFSADGNYPPTRAKPEVWQQPAEFLRAQQVFTGRVDELVAAAQAGTLEGVRPAVGAVEAACKACHDRFRNTAR
jgi:cytochrome c556